MTRAINLSTSLLRIIDVLFVDVVEFELGDFQRGITATGLDVCQATDLFGWYDRPYATPSYAGEARFSTSGRVEQWLNGRVAPAALDREAWETAMPGKRWCQKVGLHQ